MDSDKMELDYELMEKDNKIDNKNQISYNTKMKTMRSNKP